MESVGRLMLFNTYKNKKVLITGNTGFKGSWLTAWLLKMGSEVVGISVDVPTRPSMFEDLRLKDRIKHFEADIADFEAIAPIIKIEKPDFIFHLAAQAIVSESYLNPSRTFATNVIGTINILECLKTVSHNCVAVLITSDKCYDNIEWVWGYKETDALGGKDIYSGSKGAAELAIKSYFHSFLKSKDNLRIGIGRAGNVIGGGDWAKDRIVVDCFKAWANGEIVEIRSPNSTRPWQLVLEPLSGYLTLGAALSNNMDLNGEAFNFGPKFEQNRTVIDLLTDLSKLWGFNDISNAYKVNDNILFHEAGLLKLNCDKALFHLKWEANLHYKEMVEFVGDWYSKYYREKIDMYKYTLSQIELYEGLAKKRGLVWTQ